MIFYMYRYRAQAGKTGSSSFCTALEGRHIIGFGLVFFPAVMPTNLQNGLEIHSLALG